MTHLGPAPAGQDLRERLQAGSGRRAQRYPLRPFSIVSAYPPTAKLSIDGLRASGEEQTLVGLGGIFKCGIGADGDDDDAASTNCSDHRVFEIWCNAYHLDIGIDA